MIGIDIKELKRAYQAGIFDGEGHCFRSQMHLKVGIAQANWPFLEAFREEFGGGVVETNPDNWQWNCMSAPEQLIFLRSIQPYLTLKAREVIIAIEICKLTPPAGTNCDAKNQLLRERLFELLEQASEIRRFGYRKKIA